MRTLGIFATKLPELRPSIVILLKRSLSDEDDEVRDRAAILLHSFETVVDNESTLNFLLDQPLPMSFSSLERSVRAYTAHPSSASSAKPITFSSLPIVEDAYVPATASQVQSSAASTSTTKSIVTDDASAVDPAAALYKVPEFVQLGRPFRTTRETALTESEMEYVVKCVKHIFDDHVVLQFSVLNTIDDQRLMQVTVNVEGHDDGYEIEHVIPAEVARYGEPSNCFVSLLKVTEDPVPLSLACELKFTVVQVDPTTGEVEGDEDGYEEEYPLEELDISTNDYMAKVSFPDFRKMWEETGNEGEVIEKFSLQFKKLSDALAAVVEFLGMQPCDNTGVITAADASKKSHTLHLSGMFIGHTTVLVRAQLQLDEANGVVLKMAVRSESQDISTLVAECIQ